MFWISGSLGFGHCSINGIGVRIVSNGGSSESNLPDSDFGFEINSETDYDTGADSEVDSEADSRVESGDDSGVGSRIDSEIGIGSEIGYGIGSGIIIGSGIVIGIGSEIRNGFCNSGPTIRNRFQKTSELAGIASDESFMSPITDCFRSRIDYRSISG